MKLLEYQGKKMFEKFNIAVPRGKVVNSGLEAEKTAAAIGKDIVLKAQVPVGGRGKLGGIRILKRHENIRFEADNLLDMKIKGFAVKKLLIEEKLDIFKEIYMGIVVNTDTGNILFLFSPEGGVDIEKVADSNPEKVFQLIVNPLEALSHYQLRPFIRQSGFQGKLLEEIVKVAERLLKLFLSKDLLVGEINPLAVLSSYEVVAGDAKVEIDDNALFRQDHEPKKETHITGVTYIKLDGNIGVIASGAGLGMATMDLLDEKGYPPANFLETGGGITEKLMYDALKLVCKNRRVKGVIINLYGGINSIEEGAKGIVQAMQDMKSPPPVVVKALGNRQRQCWDILKKAGITVVTSVRTEDAVKSIISLVNSGNKK